MWAAYKGRTDVAQLLLEKGANPNITGQVLRLDISSCFPPMIASLASVVSYIAFRITQIKFSVAQETFILFFSN